MDQHKSEVQHKPQDARSARRRPNPLIWIVAGAGSLGLLATVLLVGLWIITGWGRRSTGLLRTTSIDSLTRQLAEAGVTRNADWTPYTEVINGAEMALVPAGCFLMGDLNTDGEEQPAHEVCFDQPFWIDVYEVTNALHGKVVTASNCIQRSSKPDQPRVCITWDQAEAHCESRGARLPTEAEWEYAARGPDNLTYPWGNDFVAGNVVYGGNSGGRTWEVGSKPEGVSWVGVHDLSGNVWEWINDWHGGYPSGRQVNPSGPGCGNDHVVRGGSWSLVSPDYLHGANRTGFEPDYWNNNLGFRCAHTYSGLRAGFATAPSLPSDEPTPTGQRARQLAEAGVTRNADWTPYTEVINGVEMALVPAGCFLMGISDGYSDEQPVHEVCFGQPFWIDVYEVTHRQYGAVATDYAQWSSEPDQPHIGINWHEAKTHCESHGARLPTEAEWEYAARGPDGLIYPWGNVFTPDNVAYWDNSGVRTWEVGSKPGGMSWIGAHDLSGNVWEWVDDWYGSYSSGQQVDPTGPDSGDTRVLRGGSWLNLNTSYLRSTFRYGLNPDHRINSLGFRCALSYQP